MLEEIHEIELRDSVYDKRRAGVSQFKKSHETIARGSIIGKGNFDQGRKREA